ncbi:MAG: DUF1549 domain-containing protein [Phycisphaera sp.]|nr:DUF1549 domain-containing protein [Phycisphaera sp.]
MMRISDMRSRISDVTCAAVAAVLCATVAHAADAPAKPDPAGVAFFESKVRPILAQRCYKCHSAKAERLRGNLYLDTRAGWVKGGDNGQVILPGDVEGSMLVKAIRYTDPDMEMPPKGKLPAKEIDVLEQWVKMGAPDPRDAPLPKATKRVINFDTARQQWPYTDLSRPAVPPVKDTQHWARTPIDRFILAKLESAGIAPSRPADRRVLIRRAYFDLIGLPPTPEQVDAFINDPAPNAWEKVIDELLASPHYGERWGRHWLDVARFAESFGFEQDYDRPNAYHYRDFVIKALNSDMPYDRFVRWQVAGDEIAPDEPLAMMATGFLGAGVFPTQLTEKEFESARYEEMDDMTQTLGTAMLGLTVGCARCHDHKFDPIENIDYYRMVATFTTTIRSEIDIPLDSDENAKATAKWEAEREPLAAALAAYEANELPAAFAKWAANAPAEAEQPKWTVINPTKIETANGTTLKRLDDGSLLATGQSPNQETYTLTAEVFTPGVTAIRLEALTDPSLPHNGPGRAGNGNFVLGDIDVLVAPIQGKAQPYTAKLVTARTTHQQNTGSLSIAASINDDNPTTGWAVDYGGIGKDQAAVFEFAEPIAIDGGARLTITMKFGHPNAKHVLGHLRLSTTTHPVPVGIDGNTGNAATTNLVAAIQQAGGLDKLDAKRRTALLDQYKQLDTKWAALNAKVQQHDAAKPKLTTTKVMVSSEGLPHMKHHADGRGYPHFYPKTYVLSRGDPNQKKQEVTTGYLRVLMRHGFDESHWHVDPPAGWRTSYRRLSMSNWLTDVKDGAGNMLARVMANRLWQHHMGRGLVITPNDFGKQGEDPVYPELIDWLAAELVDGGWTLKRMHKLIMTSAVYTQAVVDDPARRKIDPENRLWWTRDRRRLEAEIVRDNMLSVAGILDDRMFGPGTLDDGHKRRGIYFFIKRGKLVPMLMLFDAPEPLVGHARRDSTTIAPQALLLMNNPYVRQWAEAFAARLRPAADRSLADAVAQGYRLALARDPSQAELEATTAFVEQQAASYTAAKKPNARDLALADLAQTIMSLNEFIYIE